jgi:hypothetical protein
LDKKVFQFLKVILYYIYLYHKKCIKLFYTTYHVSYKLSAIFENPFSLNVRLL